MDKSIDARLQRVRQRLEGKTLPIVLFIIFLDVLGLGILIPVMPQLIYEVFEPAGLSVSTSLIMLGWLTAIYPLIQFLSTPVLGQLSDRFGRRRVLSLSLLGTGIGYIIFAIGIVTRNIPLLFVGRALDGLTGGNISVARAVIADVTQPKHRARNFGLLGAMFGIGFVAGPFIGARLATPDSEIFGGIFGGFMTPNWFSTATPFWFAAILSLMTVLLVLFFLPETNRHIDIKLKLNWNKSLHNIRRAANRPDLRIIFIAEFLFWGGFTFFTTFFQIYLIEKLGFKTGNVGDFFAYIGICIAVSQAAVVPIAVKYFKSHHILRVSLACCGVLLLALLVPRNTTELIFFAPLVAMFNGLVMANSTALVSLSAKPNEQGEIFGVEASVQALAYSIPAIISGYVATLGVNMPVIVGGSTVLLGAIIFNVFYRLPKRVDLQEDKHQLPAPNL